MNRRLCSRTGPLRIFSTNWNNHKMNWVYAYKGIGEEYRGRLEETRRFDIAWECSLVRWADSRRPEKSPNFPVSFLSVCNGQVGACPWEGRDWAVAPRHENSRQHCGRDWERRVCPYWPAGNPPEVSGRFQDFQTFATGRRHNSVSIPPNQPDFLPESDDRSVTDSPHRPANHRSWSHSQVVVPTVDGSLMASQLPMHKSR